MKYEVAVGVLLPSFEQFLEPFMGRQFYNSLSAIIIVSGGVILAPKADAALAAIESIEA
jgi:hypothetical protein